jgi:SAM-dependent methyltransferase
MADGRDMACWDNHARECEEEARKPFEFDEYSLDGPKGYPHVPNPKKNWLRDTMVSLDGIADVLDIGCGPCYWINLFKGFRYHGFDQSPEMLRVATKVITENDLLGNLVELYQGNARKLEETFPEKKFDLIFTSAVLQHNRHDPDKIEIVRGMHNILRPGGYYLCTENTFRADNCPRSVGMPQYTDGDSFTPEGWEKFMLENGFETVEYHAPSEYLYRKI